MTGHFEITAMCLHADTPLECPEFREQVVMRNRMKSMQLNRKIWMSEHYRKTGHHRFELGDLEVSQTSVATIVDPNQLKLSDDPLYSTITLGEI